MTERLQAMIPSAELVRFNNSATEVVLSALRLGVVTRATVDLEVRKRVSRLGG